MTPQSPKAVAAEERARELERIFSIQGFKSSDEFISVVSKQIKLAMEEAYRNGCIDTNAIHDSPRYYEGFKDGQVAMREEAAKSLPTNWTDSILTGKDKIDLPWNCPEIEFYTTKLKERISSLPIKKKHG